MRPPQERWAIFSWRKPTPDLRRLRVIKTPWFGIYIHEILGPDCDRDLHDHPWNFTSFVLRGAYTEEYQEDPQHMLEPDSTLTVIQQWKRGTRHHMPTTAAHRIIKVEPGTVTLVLVGPKTRDWGFWTKHGFVRWWVYRQQWGGYPA
jgi:hypothetical protein